MFHLLALVGKLLAGAVVFGKTFIRVSRVKKKLRRRHRAGKESEITMKKSAFVAVVMALAAAVGALVAVAVYLRRREKELDEYERLLFSEDFDGDDEPGDDAQAAEATEPDPADEIDKVEPEV